MAAAESKRQHSVREAEAMSRGQRLMDHRQNFGFISWGNGKH